jgi:hypothetical protein
MKTLYPTVSKAVFSAILTAIIFFTAQSATAQLVFKNPSIEIGNDGALNTVYRFSNVTANVDALVRIDSMVNGASVVEIDQKGYGFDNALQPRIQSGGNGTSYVVFSVKFVAANTSNPVTLSSVTPTNLDLDGNDNLKEFCEFNLNGGSATYMSNTPEINVTGNNGKFLAKNIAGNEYNGIDTTASAVMFYVKRSNVSEFSFRLGAIVSNNSHAARQYSVYMKEFSIANAVVLPLTLVDFNAVVKNEKVQLNWATTNHKDFSHFILQRSTDGRNFTDVMTLMSDEGDNNAMRLYNYKDDVKAVTAKVVYYRLQLVDITSNFEYSPVRLVKLTTDNSIAIQTFPNPVTNEVRVMIPASWQAKSVTYEIYNASGKLMNRIQNQNAGQVQQMNVQSYNNGMYVVKVSNGTETLTKQIIKN